jgi:YjjG family noncanonical pyrimidine nucleotidase
LVYLFLILRLFFQKETLMVFKHLIFDLDDTLLDFTGGETAALTRIFAAHGLTDTAAALRAYKDINAQVWSDIEVGGDRQMLLNTRFARLFETFGQAVNGATLEAEYRRYLDRNYRLVPGATALLRELKAAGYTLLVGTNGVASTQRQRLAHTGLLPYFDDIFISEEVGAAKPNPAFFQAVFAGHPDYDPAETMMIGDGVKPDILGATALGLATTWVNLAGKPVPADLPTERVIKSLAELPPLLG